ncbi:MAG: hypothetical protein K0Q67_1115 [Cellvibrio sp.]|jgi:hypothetical protein|nr:hypothetical protein [Cellvibrio sp.]
MAFFIGAKAVLFSSVPTADEAVHVARELAYKPNPAFIYHLYITNIVIANDCLI